MSLMNKYLGGPGHSLLMLKQQGEPPGGEINYE